MAMQILDDGPSRKGGYHCYKIEGDDVGLAEVEMLVRNLPGTRYVDMMMSGLTFEANDRAIATIRAKVVGPKKRALVFADQPAGDMGLNFDGFGKIFRLREGDACVYGLPPEHEGSMVRFAYYTA